MYNETIRRGYNVPRAAISSDDTLVTAAVGTMKNANIPAYAFSPDSAMNAIEVAFTMGADAQACVAYIFAARKDGTIVQAWTSTITAGKQVSDVGTDVWVDTLSGTDTWITTIKEVDGGGNDRQARVVFDSCGYEKFFVQFTGLSSETARAFFSGF